MISLGICVRLLLVLSFFAVGAMESDSELDDELTSTSGSVSGAFEGEGCSEEPIFTGSLRGVMTLLPSFYCIVKRGAPLHLHVTESVQYACFSHRSSDEFLIIMDPFSKVHPSCRSQECALEFEPRTYEAFYIQELVPDEMTYAEYCENCRMSRGSIYVPEGEVADYILEMKDGEPRFSKLASYVGISKIAFANGKYVKESLPCGESAEDAAQCRAGWKSIIESVKKSDQNLMPIWGGNSR